MENEEKTISEAASENRKGRGRPSVFQRDNMEDFERICKISAANRTRRTQVAEYYRSSVFGILEEHNDIEYLEEIFKIDTKRCTCSQKGEIIEQLGRMLLQDGYGEDTVIYAAKVSANLYHKGYTVKEISAYLRKVRKMNSWDV